MILSVEEGEIRELLDCAPSLSDRDRDYLVQAIFDYAQSKSPQNPFEAHLNIPCLDQLDKKKLRILDLCCRAGGCSVGYSRAGFEVVGVDLEPQKDYPVEQCLD